MGNLEEGREHLVIKTNLEIKRAEGVPVIQPMETAISRPSRSEPKTNQARAEAGKAPMIGSQTSSSTKPLTLTISNSMLEPRRARERWAQT